MYMDMCVYITERQKERGRGERESERGGQEEVVVE